ncbi:MAG: TldD/PmbA family protein [Candidatus Micrarchaeota archaeon]|nr:TldD/PmbA family protein [Candidatus Micrarchaeota archaeon]
MEIDYGIADYAMSVAGKAGLDYAEAYLRYDVDNSYAIEQGIFNGGQYAESAGLRIRLIKGKKLYTFSTNMLEKKVLDRAIRGFRGFKGIDTELSSEPDLHSSYGVKENARTKPEDFLDDLSEIDRAMGSLRYVKYRGVYGGFGSGKEYIVNTEGNTVRSSIPVFSAVVSMSLAEGSDKRDRILQYGIKGSYRNFKALGIMGDVLDNAKEMHSVMRNGVNMSEDQIKKVRNVVIAPEITGIAVHESVGHPNEADRIYGREAAQAGTSYLTKDNLGMSIGSGIVSIYDDPTIKNTYGFYMFDEEGVRAGKRCIVKNGRQNELLTNREYAHILGKHSNGSSRSDSYSNEPMVRMGNTYLGNGTSSLDELVEEARDGVYIKNFTEWNIDDTRSFSRYQGNVAYMIKNGRLGKPIKNYRLEKGTLDFWHAVKMLGNDIKLYVGTCGKGEPMQGVPVTMGGPSVLLSFK